MQVAQYDDHTSKLAELEMKKWQKLNKHTLSMTATTPFEWIDYHILFENVFCRHTTDD